MELPDRTSLQEEEQKSRRRWLLLLLLLLLLITSTIVGFILGRQAGPGPLGQVIDTILLTPEPDIPAAQTMFHLSGSVFYSNGSPAAGHTLELHSDPVTAVTDSKGGFLFANIPEGAHSITVLNADGSVAARRDVDVMRSSDSKNVSLDLRDNGKYVIELSIDVRVLEIKIQLDTGELYINPDFSYATADGTVITPSGTASIQEGVIVSPGGNVYLPDGNIVFPGGSKNDPAYILQPDDTLIVSTGIVSGEISVAPDGTVSLPDGTVIEPGGLITTPDGGTKTPGDTGVIVDNAEAIPIGGQPREPQSEETPPESSAAQPSRPSQDASSETGSAVSPQPEESSGNDAATQPDQPDTPDSGEPDTPPITDEDSFQVSAENKDGGFTAWEQHCIIDLFYNRATGQVETIAPGSGGYYLFQLKNTRKKNVTVTLSMEEEDGSSHIPLQFTLRPRDQETGGSSGSLVAGHSLSLQTEIAAQTDTVYQLDWEWPFNSGNDEADTAAGLQGGAYMLKLVIHAQETD